MFFLPKPNFMIEIKDHSMTYSKPSLCLNHYIAELVENSTKAYIIDALVSDVLIRSLAVQHFKCSHVIEMRSNNVQVGVQI